GRDRARQGTVGVAAGAEVPGPGGDQPVGQHDRLVPAAALLGEPDRRHGDEPAKHRAAVAARPDTAGHVPRGQRLDDLLLLHGHRDADFGSLAGLDRPADPHGAVSVADDAEVREYATDLAGPAVAAAPGRSEAEERVSLAPNWKLVWWRFKKHRLAMLSAGVLVLFYLVVLVPDFFSTQDPEAT